MPIMIEFDGEGGIRSSSWVEDHEHWDDGFDSCGTCGADIGPQQVGREYAIHRPDGWHIATWDGEAFKVTSNWQSGDRWTPEWVDRRVLLPEDDRNADASSPEP